MYYQEKSSNQVSSKEQINQCLRSKKEKKSEPDIRLLPSQTSEKQESTIRERRIEGGGDNRYKDNMRERAQKKVKMYVQ